MLGREVKSRFSLMKPPIVKEVIERKQNIAVKNFKGKRNKKISVGQKVYVRNYKNPNKAGWSPATVERKIGTRNYTCLLTLENRPIKRHLDQIRDAQSDEEDDYGANTPSNEEENGQLSSDEEEGSDSQTFSSPIVVSDTSVDLNETAQGSPDADESVPDIHERPSIRECASRAKGAIASMFASNRNR